jgi:hypothetical protein
MPVVSLDRLQQFTAVNLLLDPGAIGGPKIIPSCVEVVLNWGLTDLKIGHNVLHAGVGAAFSPTAAEAQSVFAALTTGSAWTGLAAVLATDTALLSVTLRDLRTANQPLVSSTGAAVAGTGAGIALPNETAVCVTLRTPLGGRSGRGRMYLPGFTVAAVGAGNIITPAVTAAVTTWVATIPAALTAGGMSSWVIALPARAAYTGTTGTAHPARAASTTPVTAAILRDNHWDSQRRRGLK